MFDFSHNGALKSHADWNTDGFTGVIGLARLVAREEDSKNYLARARTIERGLNERYKYWAK